MAGQASLVEEGRERVSATFRSIDEEVQRLQKQFEKGRKTLERRTRKRVNRLESEFRRHPLVKRAKSLRTDAIRQFEDGMDGVLNVFNIASKRDVQRLDRRLGQFSRKLKELERVRKANGDAARV